MSSPYFATPLYRFPAFFLFFSCFWATALADNIPSSFTKQSQPSALPSLLVYCPDRREIPLSQMVEQRSKGHPFFLHLWAPTCANCHEEIRQIAALSARFDSLNLPIITLAQDHAGSVSVPAFARRYGIQNISLCYDPASAALLSLHPDGIPVTYYVSASNQIEAVHLGPLDWSALAQQQKGP